MSGCESSTSTTPTLEYDPDDPEGYRGGVVNFKEAIGARTMTGKLFELPPGQALCPYHWETDEEWLLVLQGRLHRPPSRTARPRSARAT